MLRSGRFIATLYLSWLISGALRASEVPEFPIWPSGAPGAIGNTKADIPTLTPFLPGEDIKTGSAVIVCPGGGYGHLADHEGRPIAEWLNSAGITAFVLKYRHAPRYMHPAPFQDAARAVRTVRARASEWGIDPARIGMIGFSAGGHLVATAGTHFDAGLPNAEDPVERVSSRPDVMILVYPVITMRERTHAGSRKNLLGEKPKQELIVLLSNEAQVTEETPPAFLIHTMDDKAVHYENSVMFARALRKYRIPHEIHLFASGPHGFGLGEKNGVLALWPKLCEGWLEIVGFGKKKN